MAYYPWRRAVVAVLGPRAFRAVRLDRNRNMITAEEQTRLAALRIGVAGLSAGHVIAHTLAAQGLCGELRLADFDCIELSNLNRVPATVLDLRLNKAEVAARRIAELDPYLPVRVLDVGLTVNTVDEFLDGLDVVVEECDSLDMKASLRAGARARRMPVLYGQVFEGRFGGMTRSVQGTHTGGFNRNTWAVCMIGEFDAVGPTPVQVRTVGRLLGWRLAMDGIDPHGSVALTSDGGPYTHFPQGAAV